VEEPKPSMNIVGRYVNHDISPPKPIQPCNLQVGSGGD
jgi:hypothetical protein